MKAPQISSGALTQSQPIKLSRLCACLCLCVCVCVRSWHRQVRREAAGSLCSVLMCSVSNMCTFQLAETIERGEVRRLGGGWGSGLLPPDL